MSHLYLLNTLHLDRILLPRILKWTDINVWKHAIIKFEMNIDLCINLHAVHCMLEEVNSVLDLTEFPLIHVIANHLKLVDAFFSPNLCSELNNCPVLVVE